MYVLLKESPGAILSEFEDANLGALKALIKDFLEPEILAIPKTSLNYSLNTGDRSFQVVCASFQTHSNKIGNLSVFGLEHSTLPNGITPQLKWNDSR